MNEGQHIHTSHQPRQKRVVETRNNKKKGRTSKVYRNSIDKMRMIVQMEIEYRTQDLRK